MRYLILLQKVIFFVFLGILLFYSFLTFPCRLLLSSSSTTLSSSPTSLPQEHQISSPTWHNVSVHRGGVVFFSNGVDGRAREAAFSLARRGYHVLLGVRTLQEKASFAYVQQKGVETILFSIEDPSSYQPVIDRLRRIRRDLDRPLAGIVVNLAEEGLNDSCHNSNQDITVKKVDECYRRTVRASLRMLEALWELRRSQSIHEGSSSTASSSSSLPGEVGGKMPWDAQGMRIVLVTNSLGDSVANVLHETVTKLFDRFARAIFLSSDAYDFSVSTIAVSSSNRKREDLDFIPWTLELDGTSASEEPSDTDRVEVSAFLHAFLSHRPFQFYKTSSMVAHEEQT
eukprot:gene4588-5030_t